MTNAVQQRGVGKRAAQVLLASIGLTVVLYAVPFGGVLAYPLVLLSTLFHELGHGLTAAALGGRFDAFVMYPDASGAARFSGSLGSFGQAAVAAGGLVGPAVVAALLFIAARRRRLAQASLWILAVALLAAEVLVVRNGFGLVFVGAVVAALAAVAWRASPATSQIVLVFLGVQLALSVFSRADYLFTDVARTGAGAMPSDVAQMSAALGLPYWVWGLACGGASVLVLLMGVWSFLRGVPGLGRRRNTGLSRLRH